MKRSDSKTPFVVFATGNIGVGKTTIAGKIAQSLGAQHVDIDMHKVGIIDPSQVSETIDPLELRNAYCQKAIEHHLQRGEHRLVMDEIFPFKAQRQFVTDFVQAAAIKVIWVYVTARQDIVLNRLTRPRDGHLLDINQARRLYGEFERVFEIPDPLSEPHVHIANNTDTTADIIIPDLCIM